MQFTALPTPIVRALQSGGPDIHGQPAERSVSDGAGTPCRHCLRDVPAGAGMLVLAYRPFPDLHPYAEAGPIFLCAAPCEQGGGAQMPAILDTSPDYLIKGYNAQDRIVYGTGIVIAKDRLEAQAEAIFADPRIAYIHVRSARNNCYQLRIDRD